MIVLLGPAPCSVRILLIVRVVPQVHVPAGMTTVSPSAAALTAAPTSARLQLAAFLVAASALTAASSPTATMKPRTLIFSHPLLKAGLKLCKASAEQKTAQSYRKRSQSGRIH